MQLRSEWPTFCWPKHPIPPTNLARQFNATDVYQPHIYTLILKKKTALVAMSSANVLALLSAIYLFDKSDQLMVDSCTAAVKS